jgi:hypothetical protein
MNDSAVEARYAARCPSAYYHSTFSTFAAELFLNRIMHSMR